MSVNKKSLPALALNVRNLSRPAVRDTSMFPASVKIQKTYYQDDCITIYNDNCINILSEMDPGDVIITDPVWPGCEKIFPGIDAYKIFKMAGVFFPRLCKRLVVVMGVDSDPRFLTGVPEELPFFRVCWMGIIPVRYRGTLLAGADVAYVFGERYLNKDAGQVRCIPGSTSHSYSSKEHVVTDHPCPRYLGHMEWLVGNYTRPGQTIIDPFMGSGTIGIAVKNAGGGRKYIGIEIEERYCAAAVKRMRQENFAFTA